MFNSILESVRDNLAAINLLATAGFFVIAVLTRIGVSFANRHQTWTTLIAILEGLSNQDLSPPPNRNRAEA